MNLTKLTKLALMASMLLAMSLAISCSDSKDDPPPPGTSSVETPSSSSVYEGDFETSLPECGASTLEKDEDGNMVMYCDGNIRMLKCPITDRWYKESTEFCVEYIQAKRDTILELCGVFSEKGKYDPKTEFCANGDVGVSASSGYFNTVLNLCGGSTYHPDKAVCNDSKTGGFTYLKCGAANDPVDTLTHFCAFGGDAGMEILRLCNGEKWTFPQESCENDSLLVLCGAYDKNLTWKERERYQNVGLGEECCGKFKYDPKKQACYDETATDELKAIAEMEYCGPTGTADKDKKPADFYNANISSCKAPDMASLIQKEHEWRTDEDVCDPAGLSFSANTYLNAVDTTNARINHYIFVKGVSFCDRTKESGSPILKVIPLCGAKFDATTKEYIAGTGEYNSLTQFCDVPAPTISIPSPTEAKDGVVMSMCNDGSALTDYDPKTHFCNKKGKKTPLCNGSTYDSDSEYCCENYKSEFTGVLKRTGDNGGKFCYNAGNINSYGVASGALGKKCGTHMDFDPERYSCTATSQMCLTGDSTGINAGNEYNIAKDICTIKSMWEPDIYRFPGLKVNDPWATAATDGIWKWYGNEGGKVEYWNAFKGASGEYEENAANTLIGKDGKPTIVEEPDDAFKVKLYGTNSNGDGKDISGIKFALTPPATVAAISDIYDGLCIEHDNVSVGIYLALDWSIENDLCNDGKGGKCEDKFRHALTTGGSIVEQILFKTSDFSQKSWDEDAPIFTLSDALENFTGFKISYEGTSVSGAQFSIKRIGWFRSDIGCQWAW